MSLSIQNFLCSPCRNGKLMLNNVCLSTIQSYIFFLNTFYENGRKKNETKGEMNRINNSCSQSVILHMKFDKSVPKTKKKYCIAKLTKITKKIIINNNKIIMSTFIQCLNS